MSWYLFGSFIKFSDLNDEIWFLTLKKNNQNISGTVIRIAQNSLAVLSDFNAYIAESNFYIYKHWQTHQDIQQRMVFPSWQHRQVYHWKRVDHQNRPENCIENIMCLLRLYEKRSIAYLAGSCATSIKCTNLIVTTVEIKDHFTSRPGHRIHIDHLQFRSRLSPSKYFELSVAWHGLSWYCDWLDFAIEIEFHFYSNDCNVIFIFRPIITFVWRYALDFVISSTTSLCICTNQNLQLFWHKSIQHDDKKNNFHFNFRCIL